MAAGRFYVYRNGAEVKDHPLHGAVWAGNFAPIGKVNGYDVVDGVYVIRNGRNVPVNADYVQSTPVMLKEWWPPGENGTARMKTRWWVFATAGMVEAAGKGFDPVDPPKPAGEPWHPTNGAPPESKDWGPDEWEWWVEVGQHEAAARPATPEFDMDGGRFPTPPPTDADRAAYAADQKAGRDFNRVWAGYKNEYARLEAEAEAAAYRAEMEAEAAAVAAADRKWERGPGAR